MKKFIPFMALALMPLLHNVKAQSLEKMQWFNEPQKWEIKITVCPYM